MVLVPLAGKFWQTFGNGGISYITNNLVELGMLQCVCSKMLWQFWSQSCYTIRMVHCVWCWGWGLAPPPPGPWRYGASQGLILDGPLWRHARVSMLSMPQECFKNSSWLINHLTLTPLLSGASIISGHAIVLHTPLPGSAARTVEYWVHVNANLSTSSLKKRF